MTQASEPQNSNTSENAGVVRAAAGLKLYDTASHTVSRFTPIKPGQVGIYVCGATVQSSRTSAISERPSRSMWCGDGCCGWDIRSRSCAT